MVSTLVAMAGASVAASAPPASAAGSVTSVSVAGSVPGGATNWGLAPPAGRKTLEPPPVGPAVGSW